MLKLDTNDEVLIRNWPVVINVPQDGGGSRQHEIVCDFVLLPQDEYDAQLETSRNNNENEDLDMLRRVVRGMRGVADAEGNELGFTPELLDRVIKKTYVRQAMFRAYHEANSGKKAKRKNS